MTDDNTPYLAALKNEISGRLLSSLPSGMPQQIAMCSFKLIGRLIVNAEHLPAIQNTAVQSFTSRLPALKLLLSTATIAELEKALNTSDYRKIESVVQQVISELINDNSSTATAELQKIISIDKAAKQAIMDAYNNEIALVESEEDTAVFTDEKINRLTDFLRQQYPNDSKLSLGDIKLIPGGFSKQTIIVSINHAASLPASIVIRLDKENSPVGTTVVDEFNIIKILFESGVAVPEPFLLESTGDVLGGAFLLVSKVEGNNIGDGLDVQGGSREIAIDFARKLAKMHSVSPQKLGDQIAGAKVSTKERMIQDIDGFEQQWRSFERPSIALETAFSWLKKNIDLADGPRCVVHKDLGCHNILVADNRVSAFLDWETAAIGSAAQDLGYLHRTITQMCDWESFIEAYGDQGAHLPTEQQIQYYSLWGYTWLNVMLMSAATAFTSRQTDDILLGYAGTYFLSRMDAALANEVAQVVTQ